MNGGALHYFATGRMFELPGSDVPVFIAAGRLHEAAAIIDQVSRALARVPQALGEPRALTFAGIPDPDSAGDRSSSLAIAFSESGTICFWNVDDSFSQMTLEHELAHLCDRERAPGGPPAHLAEAWTAARQADARLPWLWRVCARLFGRAPELPIGRVQFESKISRELEWGSEWVSPYAEDSDSEREDWAEAVSFYLYDRRNNGFGRLLWPWQRTRFSKLWPARAALLDRFFAEEPGSEH